MKPNMTSEGFLRVMFRSNNDNRVQGGARCLVECGGNAPSRSLDVLTGLLDELDAAEAEAEKEDDFEDDLDFE